MCLGISLESLRDDVKWKAGRFYRREEVEKAIALYDDMGVVVDLYFLIGLPGDSVESIKKIPEYSFNIMRKHTHVWVVPPFPYTIDPNCPMALKPGAYGVKLLFKSIES